MAGRAFLRGYLSDLALFKRSQSVKKGLGVTSGKLAKDVGNDKVLGCGLAGWASLAGYQEPLPTLRLDQDFAIGGIAFGQTSQAMPGFEKLFRRQGKPRLRTQLYQRQNDTTQLGGLGHPASYWFRQGQFIGIDWISCKKTAPAQALRLLTSRYGQPQADTTSGEFYWLGRRTFISLQVPRRERIGGCISLMIGSLAMLNEQVYETAVRARARRVLHWQPDSLGLPRQFPSR